MNITFNEKLTDRNASRYNGKYYYEQLVLNEIMEGYDPRSLPFLPNPNKTLNTTYVPITVQLELFGINSVDFISGDASFKGAFRERWQDTTLQWDPKKFGGVKSIKLPTHPETDGRVWVPDFVITEDSGEQLLSNTKFTDLVLNSSGFVFNEVFGEFLIGFNSLIDYYPFDVQNVTMTFGSSSYDKSLMPIVLDENPFLVLNPETFNQANI